ncbi:MAG: hydrolase [Alkalicoccus sp.]|nr:MAG: hydrolase [Alkalicoccus sp.]
MLNKHQTMFVLVDVQGRLAEIVHESSWMQENLVKLVRALKILDVPIIWLEQYPEGLGPTSPTLAVHLKGIEPIKKMTFNGCYNPEFTKKTEGQRRQQVIVGGIEAHVCVCQTSLGLKNAGYEVHVPTDAVSSRTPENKNIGLERMKNAGIILTGVETAVFELLETAESREFKEVIQLLK